MFLREINLLAGLSFLVVSETFSLTFPFSSSSTSFSWFSVEVGVVSKLAFFDWSVEMGGKGALVAGNRQPDVEDRRE